MHKPHHKPNPGRTALSIVREPYAWPGGYERWAITDDGGVLCPRCCKTELESIRNATPGDGWFVVAESSTAEQDGPVVCDHCGGIIT